jgi:hypothetical protein
MWIGVKRQLAVVTADSDTVRVLCQMPHIFTNVHNANMLYAYGCCDGSATAAVEEYRRRFPMRRFPDRREFSIVSNTWRECGTLPSAHMIYLAAAIGLTPGGRSTVHIYTQTVHRTTKITTCNSTNNNRTTQIATNLEECGPCPVFASFTLAFSLTTEGKARKNLSQGSRRVLVYILPKHPHITKHTHTHTPAPPYYKTHTYAHTHTLQNPPTHAHAHARFVWADTTACGGTEKRSWNGTA